MIRMVRSSLLTFSAAFAAVSAVAGTAAAQAPAAPLLPTPATGPVLELPPQQSVQAAPALPPATPYQSAPGYAPDHHVVPNHVPPQPIVTPSYGPVVPPAAPQAHVPHQSYYGPAVQPAPVVDHGRYVSPEALVLHGPLRPVRVRYKDRDNTHPLSVRQTLFVPSPCGQGQIGVDVCAPPGCPVIKVKRDGRKIEYDYGDYEVDIITKKDGELLVDYDD